MGEGKNPKGKVLLIVGIIFIVLALTADLLGLGSSAKFGWKQITLLILGVGLVVMSLKGCKCSSKGSGDDNAPPPSSTQV